MGKAVCFGLALLCAGGLGAVGQQAAVPAPAAPTSAVTAPAPAAVPAHISIDVVVEGKDGKPVPELEPADLTLLDNGQPRKILGFRRTDGTAGNKVDLPEEVIIVLDSVNMPYQAVTLLRLELVKFLRANGGHLAQPTSVFVFASEGLRIQPAPSKDGNAIADAINTAVGGRKLWVGRTIPDVCTNAWRDCGQREAQAGEKDAHLARKRLAFAESTAV
jgi:hypothetical protein